MSKPKCPLCGGTVAYQGLNSLECRTVDCDNFGGEEEEKKEFPAFPFVTELVMRVPKKVPQPSVSPHPSPKTYRKFVTARQKVKKAKVKTIVDGIRINGVPIKEPSKRGNGTVPNLDNSKGD